MKNRERIRERYLKDALTQRLYGLAASLGRISSSARRESGEAATAAALEESQYLIEWTAADMSPEVAETLVDLQAILSLWRMAWGEVQQSPLQRSLLAAQAKQWSDQVLRVVV